MAACQRVGVLSVPVNAWRALAVRTSAQRSRRGERTVSDGGGSDGCGVCRGKSAGARPPSLQHVRAPQLAPTSDDRPAAMQNANPDIPHPASKQTKQTLTSTACPLDAAARARYSSLRSALCTQRRSQLIDHPSTEVMRAAFIMRQCSNHHCPYLPCCPQPATDGDEQANAHFALVLFSVIKPETKDAPKRTTHMQILHANKQPLSISDEGRVAGCNLSTCVMIEDTD